jgi:hypothetical protein
MANSDNLIHFLSSTGQLCERHDMEHYHLERCTRKADEIWRPECGGLRGGTRVAVMFWGCIIFDGVGTLTEIEGNMNTTKYLETLGDVCQISQSFSPVDFH